MSGIADEDMVEKSKEQVKDVWNHNMVEELAKITELVQMHGYTCISFVSKPNLSD